MTGVFFLDPGYDRCAPGSHPSSCMLVNHGPSQQSSEEEYKPWKWGAAARYYALIQRPYYRRASPCRDPTGNRTTRRSPDDRKETQTEWYRHVSRSSGLAKTILQGTVKKETRQGRQKKRWENNIREWTGLEFAKSKRAVENREKRRKLVVKLSVVPQRPSRLRDRWGKAISSLYLSLNLPTSSSLFLRVRLNLTIQKFFFVRKKPSKWLDWTGLD